MDNIVVTIDGEGIALLELNRPDFLNALNAALINEVRDALADLAEDDRVRVLIITGRGRAFCAGADLVGAQALVEGQVSPGTAVAQNMQQAFNPMMEAIYAFPRPVISAVNGIAAGGGAGIALCADLVLASEDAVLKVVQAQQLGIAADLGANWLLPRIAGRSRAMALCLLGESIPAATLKEWGLAWDCVPSGELLDRAREYAIRLLRVPVETVVATRRLVDLASGLTFSALLEEERMAQLKLCDRPVFVDSINRFLGND